ncbi:PIH1 domain-containing protein 1 [Rhizoclosmatium sp. JEL0117]|nr:PIH1 domain-containing protein 1 [Rhizoclosmatium sp. JEL0117]
MNGMDEDTLNAELIGRMLGQQASNASGATGAPGADGPGNDDDDELASFLAAMAADPSAAAALLAAVDAAEKAAAASNGGAGANQNLPFPDAADPNAMKAVLAALAAKAKPQNQSDGMMQIKPKPGLVIKSHLAKTKEDWKEGMKVFINLCHSPDIPPPPTMDYEEVARAMLENDNVSFKVPLSLSAPRMDKDKAGKLCLVFDAACNTTPYEHCIKNASFHAFMVTLCCEWIESKHEITLSRDISFPKLKSKGEISVHTIRKQAKSIITEMPKSGVSAVSGGGQSGPVETQSSLPATAKTTPVSNSNAVIPHHEVFAEPPTGAPEFLVARISLPQLTTIKNCITLDVESKKIILSPVGKTAEVYKLLEVDLEHSVVIEEVGAQFDLSTRTLTITLVCEK